VETIGTLAGQAGKFDPTFPNKYIMPGSGKFVLGACETSTSFLVIAAPLVSRFPLLGARPSGVSLPIPIHARQDSGLIPVSMKPAAIPG
jgi:hypothetical protein